MTSFKNKTILVVGLGKSGFAAARFLSAHGAHVRVTDNGQKSEVLQNAEYLKAQGIRVETGGHSEEFVRGCDVVVTSPGVPKKSLPLVLAKKYHIHIISEIELASYFCKGPITAVTASNGKTTTCHLIHQLFRDAGKKSELCGNVGYSFIDSLSGIDAKTNVVLEISSFQLEDSPTLRPHIAVVLNVSRNHLDRHKTLANYIKAKEMIFKNQKASDWLILNHDNVHTRLMAKKAKSRILFISKSRIKSGIFYEEGSIIYKKGRQETYLLKTNSFKLKGEHNLENIMAAVAVAHLSGVSAASMQKTLDHFLTLEHRIEAVAHVHDIDFVNDSKSTTIDSTKAAILAMDKPVILIAGGRDKSGGFEAMETFIIRNVKKVVLYGEAIGVISSAWKKVKGLKHTVKFEDAVRMAFISASPGDVILLSPMCASFDQFNSFEHRGKVFKEIVAKLRSEA